MLNKYKIMVTILEVKVKLLEEALHQKLKKIQIEKIIEGDNSSTSDKVCQSINKHLSSSSNF